MIQRIQSVFLTLVLVCIILMFLFPVAVYTFDLGGETMEAELNLIPHKDTADISQEGFINTIYLPIAAIVLGILTIAIIFLYQNRILQIRLIAVAVLINIAYIALLFFLAADDFATVLQENFKTSVFTQYSIGSYIPLVTIFLFILAQNAIKKDEKKVRSADRLR